MNRKIAFKEEKMRAWVSEYRVARHIKYVISYTSLSEQLLNALVLTNENQAHKSKTAFWPVLVLVQTLISTVELSVPLYKS